jgi:hypothetical protein
VLPDGHRSARLSMLMTAVTVPLGLLVGMHIGEPGVGLSHHAAGRTWSCLLSGFLVAAVPATLALLALGRLIPMGAWRTALAVGGAAGVLAGLTLELHCPSADVAHLGLAHGTVMVAPAVLLALLGARLLTKRG